MSKHATDRARELDLPVSEKLVLLELAHEADSEGVVEDFDEVQLQRRTHTTSHGLVALIAALAEKGLLTGPRWTAGRGWSVRKVKLNLGESHLRSLPRAA